MKIKVGLKHFVNDCRSISLRKKCPYSESGSYFPAFGLNTERYSVSLRIQSECRKIRTRITPNTYTFQAVLISYLCDPPYLPVFSPNAGKYGPE